MFFYNKNRMFGVSVAKIQNSYLYDIKTEAYNLSQKQKIEEGSLQNGQITNFYFKKLKEQELALSFLVFINIYLIIFETDLSFPEITQSKLSSLHICQYFTIVCVIIISLLLLMRSFTALQLQISQKILYEKSTLISTKKILYLLFQWILLLLQPYPFLIGTKFSTANVLLDYPIQYPVNDILAIISFSRIYIIIRASLLLTPYMNNRSNRLCKMYGCRADYSYSLKCLFKDHPLKLICSVYLFMAAIFAYVVYLAERPLVIQNGGHTLTNVATNYANTIWLIFMTTTTVGYGDYYPQTPLGRIIVLFVAIWGTLIVSIMVVVVSNTLRMEKSQLRTSKLLNKLFLRQQLELKAVKVIGYFVLSKLAKNRSIHLISSKKFQKSKKQFVRHRKCMKQSTEINDLQDEIATHFLKLNSDIQILNLNQDKIIQYIHQNFDAKPKQTDEIVVLQNQSEQLSQEEQEEKVQPKFMELFKNQLKMKLA